jgi:hypothetical protein
VQVVVEIRAGADDEVHETALHHRHHATAQPGGRHRPGHRQANRRLVLRRQHLVHEDAAGFTQPAGVERLKAVVDEIADRRITRWPVVLNGPTAEISTGATLRRPGDAMRHGNSLNHLVIWLSPIGYRPSAHSGRPELRRGARFRYRTDRSGDRAIG